MAPLNDRLESYGIYKIARQLFDDFWNDKRVATLDHIIGGLTATINTLEKKRDA